MNWPYRGFKYGKTGTSLPLCAMLCCIYKDAHVLYKDAQVKMEDFKYHNALGLDESLASHMGQFQLGCRQPNVADFWLNSLPRSPCSFVDLRQCRMGAGGYVSVRAVIGRVGLTGSHDGLGNNQSTEMTGTLGHVVYSLDASRARSCDTQEGRDCSSPSSWATRSTVSCLFIIVHAVVINCSVLVSKELARLLPPGGPAPLQLRGAPWFLHIDGERLVQVGGACTTAAQHCGEPALLREACTGAAGCGSLFLASSEYLEATMAGRALHRLLHSEDQLAHLWHHREEP
ncbi:hypothetical protein NDU88_004293 [Pleurodeles waltl]|uniref:Uncharacterized protein n=1 Tax=Pleurodeles waltl TaxID=8319 RepID=A0AAV7V0V1_PLEWA|nr:hypothetical protein NDU88_004293 [Pleurodeles waltl]